MVSVMTVCSGPNCDRTRLAQRTPPLCSVHYYQQKRGAELTPIREPITRGDCTFDGCGRRERSRGLCQTHYVQLLRDGSLSPIGERIGKRGHFCHEPGCEERTTYRYCEAHRPRNGSCEALGCDLLRRAGNTPYCDAHARRDRALRHSYGISLRQRDAMEVQQDGLCAICHTSSHLHVDHCHDTGKIRGLLCGPCNRAIGLLDHDVRRIASAADYLR